jgi:hypothetical protein
MLTIISGGQTGVDQVALEVAHSLGFPTGGMAPLDWRTDEGPKPELGSLYGLEESRFASYRVRTIWNVQHADATIWFGDVDSPGGKLTRKTALDHQIRTLGYRWGINPTEPYLLAMLQSQPQIKVLNVAGNRLRTNPSAAALARVVLFDVLTLLRDAEAR